MFKAIKDNKIIAISDTDSKFPCLVWDAIANEPDRTTADYMQVNGEFVLTSSAEAIEQKKADVRSFRNQYLKQYVDDRAKSPFMWNEVTEEEKAQIGEYRKYLMDYPETEGWYEQNPMTFKEWKQASELEQIVASGE